MPKINFHFQSVIFTISNKMKIKRHIKNIFNSENKQLKLLNVIFCTDKYLLNLNKQYLQHNYYTDVITFDLSQNKKEIFGEIYISVDRIRTNACEYRKSFVEELYRVLIHGTLHLCGYNDKTPRDKNKMRRTENLYLEVMSVE